MLLLRRARLPVALIPRETAPDSTDALEPVLLCDILIDGERISEVVPAGRGATHADGATTVDLDGALVFPSLVDAHVHLDKAFTWTRAPNRSGTFGEAAGVMARDRLNWTEDDLRRRADFALRCAWSRGTRVMRTHVDSQGPAAEASHAVMAEMRENWRGRIELQTVPGRREADYTGTEGEALADLAIRHGACALGGMVTMAGDLNGRLDRLVAIARDRGVGLDLHVDESGDPEARVLQAVAEAVERNAFALPVVCGHACSLSVQPPERQRRTIELVRAARIGVVSLPLCNLYLQDRRNSGFPRTPYWRGLTLLGDLLAAGVPMACASDNVRDAYHAYGDFDMLEVYVQSVRLAHLDDQLSDSVRLVTASAADLVGRPACGRIAPGAPARLVIFAARSFNELLSRPTTARRCVDAENVHSPQVPEFSELDGG
jgi:cytosine/creatinine deaminase